MSALAHEVRFFIAHYGLIALFILLTIEEAGVWLPLPGDLLVVYFGYRVAHSHHPLLTATHVLMTVTLAVLCGSTILYSLAHRYRSQILRFGRIFRVDEKRINWMQRWLQRQGPLAILPGRLIPGLRIPTTVVAGLFDVPLFVFLPSIAVAGLLWGVLYLALGIAGRSLLYPLQELLETEFLVWTLIAAGVLTTIVSVIIYRRRFVKISQH